MMSLEEIRKKIVAERRFVGKKQYSHNIIGILLGEAAKQFGKDAAKKLIRDCKLDKLGWEEKE